MAKPTFAKMGLKPVNDIKIFKYGDQEIEVKQFLPVQKKLEIISNVVNFSGDDNNFANPVKIELFLELEIMYNYTNLSFTDKQKEDFIKNYDLLTENNIIIDVINLIPENEYADLRANTYACIDEIYKYRNSVLGLMDIIKTDYSEVGSNIEELWNQLSDKENVSFLREVMTKLG